MHKRVNIKDIARMAEVSITTVSQVLNGKAIRVSDEKREKIISLAKTYGYQPNQVAKSLVTKETKTIGLIIPDIENLFFSSLAKAVEDAAQKRGYLVLLMSTNDKHERHIKDMDLLLNRQVDGLLMTIPNESYNASYQKELRDRLSNIAIPIVLVDRFLDIAKCDAVYFDNVKGGYIGTRYLLEKGYRNIACITGPANTMSSEHRLKGYKKALSEYGIDVDMDFIVEGDYHLPSGKHAVDVLFERNVDFDAVFAFNDLMAYGAKEVLDHIGVKDVGIMGYDYVYLSKILGGKLSSVEQDSHQLGLYAFEMLYERMQGLEREEKVELCLTPKLHSFNETL